MNRNPVKPRLHKRTPPSVAAVVVVVVVVVVAFLIVTGIPPIVRLGNCTGAMDMASRLETEVLIIKFHPTPWPSRTWARWIRLARAFCDAPLGRMPWCITLRACMD